MSGFLKYLSKTATIPAPTKVDNGPVTVRRHYSEVILSEQCILDVGEIYVQGMYGVCITPMVLRPPPPSCEI